MKRLPRLSAAILALAVATSGAFAQAWPSKQVRVVVAFPPGTPGDVIIRLIQPSLQAAWGQTVVVENKPGAGGNLAAGEVAQARDGHTLLVGPDTVLTINPHLYKKLNFDLRASLQPVTYFASFNMAMELLLSTQGRKLTHVPYKGPGPAAQDVIAGHVDCGFIVSSVVLPHVQSGRLRAIAVSSKERSVLLTDVPTVAESRHAGFDATFFETLMAPSGLPAAVAARTDLQLD